MAGSSVRAHLAGADDALVTVGPLQSRTVDFADLIAEPLIDAQLAAIRTSEATGRALGSAHFVDDLERRLDRPVARRAPGRKPRAPQMAAPTLL